jgi:hypothetical protein
MLKMADRLGKQLFFCVTQYLANGGIYPPEISVKAGNTEQIV